MSLRNPNLLTLQPIQPRTVEVETVVKTRKRSGYLDQAVTPAAVAAQVGPHPAVVHGPGQLFLAIFLFKKLRYFAFPILLSLSYCS